MVSPLSSLTHSLPSRSPCLLKSLSASAAPAASDSVLRSREALSPRTKTHTYTHTLCSVEISQPPWTGGGSLKNDNNSAHDCKEEHVALNTSFKGSPHISINPLTHSIFSPPLWLCIAAPSQVVKKQVTPVILQIASDGHYKHTGTLSKKRKKKVGLKLNH